MQSSPAHQRAITEVQQWLGLKGLDDQVWVLLDNGYDDLDAISRANPKEIEELIDVLKDSSATNRNNLRILITTLQAVGIESFRKSKSQFIQMLKVQGEAEAPSKDDSYFSIRSNKLGKWFDKYVSLDGTHLKWLTSRKENKVEEDFDLSSDVKSVDRTDSNTIRLLLKNGETVELWSSRSSVTNTWYQSLTSFVAMPHLDEKEVEEVESSDDEEKPKSRSVDGGDPGAGPILFSAASAVSSSAASSAASTPVPSLTPPVPSSVPGTPGGSLSGPSPSPSPSSSISAKPKKEKTGGYDSESSDAEGEDSDKEIESIPTIVDGKVSTFDEAIATSAVERAVQTMNGVKPIDQSAQILKQVADREMSENEKRLQALFKMLTDGDTFKKFKRGHSDKRRVYCTDFLDFLCWGDENNVKGFMPTKEIHEINQGIGATKNRLYVVSPSRTLELEAKDGKAAKEWKSALEVLMKWCRIEQAKMLEIQNSAEWKENVKAWTDEHTQLLVVGDVFKKWPGRKKMQKGKFTCRKIWCSPKLDKIHWGDMATQKVKGFIQADEVVQIWEDPADKSKFAVIASGRTLDLEATSVWVREKWVRAFRFFITFRKTHAKGDN